jgi:hypothetical protein
MRLPNVTLFPNDAANIAKLRFELEQIWASAAPLQ